MTPEEVLRDAKDMVKNYPGDRLRLTGAEILMLVAFEIEACAQVAAKSRDGCGPDCECAHCMIAQRIESDIRNRGTT